MSTRRQYLTAAARSLAGLGLLSRGGALAPSLSGLSTHTGRPTGTGLVYDDRYLDHVLPLRRGETHPERALRLTRIMKALETRGLMDELVRLPLLSDPTPQIERHHTADHVAGVRDIEVTGEVAALAVAGALGAVDAVASGTVRNAFCASRPPGHHANNTGAEEGFCFYSNAAIAARYAQRVHGLERVLIIDWDYHHGNATQNAFYDDPSVLFVSFHDWQAYPGTGDPSLNGEGEGAGLNVNIHLDCGASDRDILAHWEPVLGTQAARFRPDLILLSAGFDSRKDDLLGCFEFTDDAFRRMTRMTMDMADDLCGGRVVSLLEGGYNVDGLALAAAAHVETLLEG